ncbi:MAG: cupin domain-containing protein [Opitutaceae bacterium]|nr:cupin domain-containing protein [Cytophagales bacterium]
MDNIREIIESGILDLYVLGATTLEETVEVERLLISLPEILDEINLIKSTLTDLSSTINKTPRVTVKPFLFASIDYMERLQGGEPHKITPVLGPDSKISDFQEWLSRDDMVIPKDFKDYHIKILTHTPAMSCAIVWIEHEAPLEVHHNEMERLLIIEGSCEITYGNEVKELYSGDYFDVPLHTDHRVVITSEIPCKVILQRIAA